MYTSVVLEAVNVQLRYTLCIPEVFLLFVRVISDLGRLRGEPIPTYCKSFPSTMVEEQIEKMRELIAKARIR